MLVNTAVTSQWISGVVYCPASSVAYRIVGTQDATQRIATGDRVRVDGGTGVVEILEAAAQPKNDLFTA